QDYSRLPEPLVIHRPPFEVISTWADPQKRSTGRTRRVAARHRRIDLTRDAAYRAAEWQSFRRSRGNSHKGIASYLFNNHAPIRSKTTPMARAEVNGDRGIPNHPL